MDIILRHIRQLEVDDVRHPLDIDPARGDVGGDEHPGVTGAEGRQRAFPLGLRFVAVNGDRLDAGADEVAHHPVCPVFRPGEDQHPGKSRLFEQRRQQIPLLRSRNEQDPLVDEIDRRRRRRNRHLDRVVEVLLGESSDRPRHRRREQQRLAPTRHQRHQPLQRVDETQVEHPVGLVQNQDLDRRERNGFLVDQIEQPSRRRDQDVHALREPALLRPDRDAAENDRRGERQLAAVSAETVGDLGRQLTRGAEHERSAGPRRRPFRSDEKPLQDRQCEGGRLAGSGLGNAAQVAAVEYLRDSLRLDRGRCRVALGRNSAENGRSKSKIGET